MKNRYVKGAVRFLAEVFTCIILLMVIDIFTKGMYLIGIPQIDKVERVTISYPVVCDEVKEISDEAQIETAVKLSGFLKYSLFEKADLSESPLITITYFTSDGDEIKVSANRKTVWWKGKAHSVKDEDIFINLTEGIFFLDKLVTN